MIDNKKKETSIKNPTLFEAFFVLILLILILYFNVNTFGEDASYGPNQIALLFTAGVAVIFSIYRGVKWDALLDGMVKNITESFPAILILLLVGTLVGTWILAGIVPTLIYYGLDLVSPKMFLITSCIISAIVSITVGSSWTTTSTIGIALMGIGTVLGINEGYLAGAVLSGAYFGDKMSPISDTTNLAPAMAGTTLIEHIRYMTYTTFPSIFISLVLFLFLGWNTDAEITPTEIIVFQQNIDDLFYISPVLLLVPLGVFYLLAKKVPSVPTLIIGAIAGSIFAIVFQFDLLVSLYPIKDPAISTIEKVFEVVLTGWFGSIQIESENPVIYDLLKSNGMAGMLNTIWLIMAAMILGGALEAGKYLHTFTHYLLKMIQGRTSLISTTAGTCLVFNVIASDQYVSIVIPGRMFKEVYPKYNLAPVNLSRTLEDSATVTSVLVPWNTCGAFQSSALGVSTFTYLPYCFFNIISPIMTVLFAYFNIKIKKINDKK